MNSPDRCLTRRQVLSAGSAVAAGLFCGLGWLEAQQKKPLCIDVHAHLWTDDYLDLMVGFGKTDTGIQRGKGAGTGQAEMEKRFTTMDAAGVDLQVLSISPQFPHFENKERAVTAARKANDMCADAVSRWPKRFAAFAAIPLPHVDESLKEIDRAIGRLGMLGVALPTDAIGRSIADPVFAPLYEELNRRGSVAFIHPSGNAALSPLIADNHATWMIGAPVEDTVAITNLITAGIPSRFPKVKIITAHVGGTLPMLLDRMDSVATWEYPQILEKPSTAARRMWYDTVSYGDVPALRLAVDTWGAERLVLGSDFPYEAGSAYELCVDYIRHAGLKQDEVDRILDRNASALLGFV
jgi:6-methylsalicylate decarboxylase